MKKIKLEAIVVLIGALGWTYVAVSTGKPVFLCAALPLLYMAINLFKKDSATSNNEKE